MTLTNIQFDLQALEASFRKSSLASFCNRNGCRIDAVFDFEEDLYKATHMDIRPGLMNEIWNRRIVADGHEDHTMVQAARGIISR